MAKAFINDENLTDIADAIRATLDESRQYLPSEMAAAIQSIPVMAQLNRKKYFQPVPAGAASGYATIEKIEGNTVVFNQLVKNGDFASVSNWSLTRANYSVSGNVATITVITGTDGYIAQSTLATIGHKYLIIAYLQAGASKGRLQAYGTVSGSAYTTGTGTFEKLSLISTSSLTNNFQIFLRNYDTSNPMLAKEVMIVDLTAIFKAGNEPTTVEEYEQWRDQNGLPAYADYNAGELLSVKMSGMQTEDNSQQTLDTLPFDVTTITGINTSTNVRETIFPQGMKQADRAGTVKDTLDLRSDTATVNVVSRAYQSGDESDTDVITDGTTTYYALTTPITYTDLQDANGNPLNPRYKVEQGGTEQVLPANTSTPTTVAPTLTTTYTKDVH